MNESAARSTGLGCGGDPPDAIVCANDEVAW
jgi:hypothetical protein